MSCNPRRWAAAAALALAGLAGATAQPASAEPKNLLFFGNSFSQQDNVPGKVGLLAQADGYEAPRIVADLQGGQTFDYHLGEVTNNPANNVASSSLPAGETWDYVVLQGFSTEATEEFNSHAEFARDAVALYEAVRDQSSGKGQGVTPMLYQTWARAVGHEYYPSRWSGPTEMQADVRAGYEAALEALSAVNNDAAVSLVGDAFEARNFELSLYDSDRYHASTSGSLLASLVIYRTTYGEDVGDIAYADVEAFAGVSEERWDVLVAAADSVATDRVRAE